MLGTVENKIRFKAILIYLIVALICGGMIFYIYNLRASIDDYKSNIEQYNEEILQMDSLVRFINVTQEEANRYVMTRRLVHLRQFRSHLEIIENQLDSLRPAQADHSLFDGMNELLKEKGSIITRLSRQFSVQQEPDSVLERMITYEPIVQTDSILITTVSQDTTIHLPPPQRRNIFQRIFTSRSEQDTVYSISTTQTDTLIIVNRPDSIPILSEIGTYTEQIRQDYQQRITSIQNEVNQLLIADQEISTRISGLLIHLYSSSIRNILNRIDEQEEEIRHVNSLSVRAGIVALALILLFIILIFSDVSKGLRARRALEEANKRIGETLESRHKLFLSVSHDIKTPLNSILGQLDTKEQPLSFSEETLSSMKNAGEHILSLLNTLVQFSGLEQGVLQVHLSSFHAGRLFREVTAICAPLAARKGLQFIGKGTPDPMLYLHSDPVKIKQILINLLSNAIKYTPSGEVRLEFSYENGKLTCTVSDTGSGIYDEQKELLFSPFTRLEGNSYMAEGTGVGMYVVKGLVSLLNGELTVRSVPEKGTSITVCLPIRQVEPAEKQPREMQTLLLIDDDHSFLTVLSHLITQAGYTCESCSPGKEFEEKLNTLSSYDLILTDMEMGSWSGMDILQAVRQTAPDIPVFVMTGRDDFNLETVYRLGFDNYISKPITSSSFESLIKGEKPEKKNETSSLEEMFAGDPKALEEVLDTFINSTLLYIAGRQEAIEKDDFYKARQIAHKMLPMFIQLDAGKVVMLLKKMDSHRNNLPEDHPEWKTETELIIRESGELLLRLRTPGTPL